MISNRFECIHFIYNNFEYFRRNSSRRNNDNSEIHTDLEKRMYAFLEYIKYERLFTLFYILYIRLKRIISMEKELLDARKQIDILKKKYSDKCRKNEKIQSRYSALKEKERKRQRDESSSGLSVRNSTDICRYPISADICDFILIQLILIRFYSFSLQQECLEILKCLKIGRKNTLFFTEAIRTFAITMHFYSPRAYKFLRDKFNKHLPSAVTIRKWYSNCTSGGEPGINKHSLKVLGALANDFKSQGKELIVTVSFDEMSIRRMVQWNEAKKKFIGYFTHGTYNTQNIPVARNVLAFLVTGLNSDFSLPIAHYFIIAMKAVEMALIINEVIAELTKLGIRIANITFDGLSTNIKACEVLGASFNILDMRPFFFNPIDSNVIRIFLDPCHMLKLARNCIASEKFIHNRTNKKNISWIFFERLEAVRHKNDFVCHKLNKKHIQWYRAKMDVRLAAENLSSSVANAMEHLMKGGVKSFQNCKETIKFTRIIDKVFDIFNSKKEKSKIFLNLQSMFPLKKVYLNF